MMAEVLGVMAASIASGFIWSEEGSQSTKTGFAPACNTGQIVVDQVRAGTMTSDPGRMRRGSVSSLGTRVSDMANSAMRLADEPELTMTACSTPRYPGGRV